MSSGLAVALPGGHGHGRGAAPSGELGFGGEPGRVADLGEQCHGGDDADTDDLGEGAVQFAQERGDFSVDLFEADGDGFDRCQCGLEPPDSGGVGAGQGAGVDDAYRLECGHDAAGRGQLVADLDGQGA